MSSRYEEKWFDVFKMLDFASGKYYFPRAEIFAFVESLVRVCDVWLAFGETELAKPDSIAKIGCVIILKWCAGLETPEKVKEWLTDTIWHAYKCKVWGHFVREFALDHVDVLLRIFAKMVLNCLKHTELEDKEMIKKIIRFLKLCGFRDEVLPYWVEGEDVYKVEWVEKDNTKYFIKIRI